MRQSPTENQEPDEMDTKDDDATEKSPLVDSAEKKKGEAVASNDIDMDGGPSRAEGQLRFEVQNFSKIKDTVYSDPVMIRNLQWRIMVMPRFSTVQSGEKMKSLGIFLQCTPEGEGSSWSCHASAKITVINQKNQEESFTRKITHLFFQKENDWGYSNFLQWQDVIDPAKGYIKNDTIIVEISVQADAPHGVFWDSKKLTGYVGLKNQGATCYMNSLLQTLFFMSELRKAVYQMPTETDDINKSVGLALQRVFYDLQFSEESVGTKKLTRSFGWETLDSFMQHDAQELCRVLLDNMESKMKGTIVEGTIPRLLEGEMVSYVQCLHVDYRSNRKEPFYDIQLSIKGKKNVYESFKEYITPEKLEGDNKYDAGDYGMQDAKKGVIFKKLSPVLHLHLLRFQYDPMTDSNYKINDRYEFPEKLDLSEFLEKPEETPSTYTLHAVLVHSGDNHGGHYVVYINPKGDGQWFKFDDDVVSHATKKEAIENNFGGHDEDLTVRHCTNAYMLVYVRDSHIGQVLQEVRDEDIPEHLKRKFQEEKRLEAQRRKERSEAHLYMDVDVVTSDVFYSWNGNDLFDIDRYRKIRFRVPKNEKLSDLMKRLANLMGYSSPDQLRLWPLSRRTNNTIRPNSFDYSNVDKKKFPTINDVDVATLSEQDQILLAFLETVDPESADKVLPPFDENNHVLLFFKYYNPRTKIMAYCGHHYVPVTKSPRELFPLMCERAGLPKDTKLLWFEEIRPGITEKINTDKRFDEAVQDLMDGDIICFQAYEPDLLSYSLPTCEEYFRDLSNQIDVILCDKNIPNDAGFNVKLSLRMQYMQLAETVAKHLGCDPMKLQFFKPQMYRDAAGSAVKCSYEGTLRDMLAIFRSRSPKKLYYQILTIPINILENKFQFKVTWLNGNLKDEQELTLFVEKEGLVSHLFKEARRHVSSATEQFRLLEIVSCKVYRVVPEDQPLEQLTPQTQRSYRLEAVNEEDLTIDEDSVIIQVAHFNKEVYNTFGTPFLLKLRDGEKVGSVRKRIREKLDMPEKEFDKIRFARVQMGKADYFSDDDDQQISSKCFQSSANTTTNRPWLGLDHVNKSSKRTRYAYAEKPIKIHN
ncbi:ubiquitin carboxyl-terminal hydrolase 7-like [Rhopilema esculentum]|uniref:ubiquitin carboxyl-terminal hydrolase 7-like n=1 Tax=Rhopilema esculentum TaxID=499914 RepID=UPI0031DD4CD7|eukprot:gene9488-17220_t